MFVMKKLLLPTVCAGFLMAAQSAMADGLGFQLEGALEAGGDDVATVFFTNGDTQNVTTGDGGTLAVGGHYRVNKASPWDTVGTVGYKFVTTAASNVDIGITRTTLKLEERYHFNGSIWAGAGLTAHSNISFDCGGLCPDMGFDDATGFVASIGWKFVALTYTNIQYTGDDHHDYDASNVGLLFTAGF
jgi:hypothetical protein